MACVCVNENLIHNADKYLVTVDQVLPFTFALIRTPPIPLLFHFPLNEHPQRFVPPGLCEVLLQLSSNSDELLGFMVSPLGNTVLLLVTPTATRGERPQIRVVHVVRPRHRQENRQHAQILPRQHRRPRLVRQLEQFSLTPLWQRLLQPLKDCAILLAVSL